MVAATIASSILFIGSNFVSGVTRQLLIPPLAYTTEESVEIAGEEHLECIKAVVDFTKKRIPVIAGTGSNCTDTASYLTKQAQNAGADAALVVTPYYNKATQNGLIAHYTDIAKHTDLPIILYNVPSRTGCKLEAATIAKLVKENGRYSLFWGKI